MPASVKMTDIEDSYSDDYDFSSDDGGSWLSEDIEGSGASGSAAAQDKSQPFRIIQGTTLEQCQNEVIESVMSILGCKRSVAVALLIHYRWDKDRVMGDFAERGMEYVYKSAGVVISPATTQPASSSMLTCSVCCTECDVDLCSAMDCGHLFCNDCWVNYLRSEVQSGKATRINCMEYKCGVVCDETVVRKLLAAEAKDVLQSYNRSRLQSYTEDNNRVKFCPSVPWCGRAVQVTDDPFCEPVCDCGVHFCFNCTMEPHSPCTCEMWRMWEEKVSGDSETKHWLVANTKPCPKCSKPVEKNGGCNLVVCKCGQPFCWLCGASTGTAHTWEKIEGHQCGRWKTDMDKKINEAQRCHKRYMHYYECFNGHLDSLKKDATLRANLVKVIKRSQETGTDAHDYQWLEHAMAQLCIARRVLANTYAMAFFLFGEDYCNEPATAQAMQLKQCLFEDHQQTIQCEVERLSNLVEKVVPPSKVTREDFCIGTISSENRLLTINSTVSIDVRIQKLYEVIENELYSMLHTVPSQIAPYVHCSAQNIK